MDFIKTPDKYSRVYNITNKTYFDLYTASYMLPNFRYLINLYVKTPNTSTFTSVATIRKRPNMATNGHCIFNPSEILQNYISNEDNLNINSLSVNPIYNSNLIYKISVAEQYMSGRGMIQSSPEYSDEFIMYNGSQEYINIDSNDYIMTTGGTGSFLTDSLYTNVTSDDQSSYLYFLTGSGTTQPKYATYTFLYDDTRSGSGSNRIIKYDINDDMYNTSPTAPGFLNSNGNTNVYIDTNWSGSTIDNKDLDIEHTGETYMWSIPTGPKQLIEMGFIDTGLTWLKYKIDIIKKSEGGNIIFNKQPYIYYNKCKIIFKYNKYELFWRNPHGGYDSYLFTIKNDLQFNISRDIYKKRLSNDYSLGDRGSIPYSVETSEVYTLKSDYLTQNELQVMVQLCSSSDVYITYNNDIIPMIVLDDTIKYSYINQNKLISLDINVTPSFNRTLK